MDHTGTQESTSAPSIANMSPSKMTTTSNQDCLLLRLPKELRNIIYHHIFLATENWIRLDTAGPLDAPLFYDCCSPLDDSHAMNLYGIILTCRQLYAETMHFYYPNSIFYFYNLNAAMRRIARMPVQYRQALVDVRACLSPRSREEAKQCIDDAMRERLMLCAQEKKKSLLIEGLRREGIELRDGVLRVGSPPADLEWGGEFEEVTELFGRGPSTARWHGMGDRGNLRRSWTLRTYRQTHELTRYQSIVKHAVDMGEKGKKMKCWTEMEGLDI